MKTVRSGLSTVLILVALAGLTVLLIGLFSSANSSPTSLGLSPVATPTGIQISPLATPNVTAVPVAHVGAAVLVHASGSAVLTGGQQRLVSIGRRGDRAFTNLLDLTTGKESKIADDALGNAHLAGHWLAYQDMSPVTSTVYYNRIIVIDLDTGGKILLGDTHANQQRPSISGDIVVWEDLRNEKQSGSDIYAYDLKAGKEFPVVATASWEIAPRISGEWVTYLTLPTQYPPGKAPNTIELRAHSLKTDEDFSIGWIPSPNNASWGTYHAIDGDKIAWVKVTNAALFQFTSELHLYDLTSRTDRKLTDHLPNRIAFDISLSAQSGIVVYNDPGGNWMVLDWLPATPVPIPVASPLQLSVDFLLVSGDYLVWRFSLNHDGSNVKLFAAPITRRSKSMSLPQIARRGLPTFG